MIPDQIEGIKGRRSEVLSKREEAEAGSQSGSVVTR
jgi:hypothetical protein